MLHCATANSGAGCRRLRRDGAVQCNRGLVRLPCACAVVASDAIFLRWACERSGGEHLSFVGNRSRRQRCKRRWRCVAGQPGDRDDCAGCGRNGVDVGRWAGRYKSVRRIGRLNRRLVGARLRGVLRSAGHYCVWARDIVRATGACVAVDAKMESPPRTWISRIAAGGHCFGQLREHIKAAREPGYQ